MELVAELNNSGAVLLASDDVDSALQCFRDALELLRLMYEDRKELPRIPTPEKSGMIPCPSSPQAAQQDRTDAWAASKTVYEHSHFVYGQALAFDPAVTLTTENWDECLPICLAIIKFNLGLASQMKSKDLGERALVQSLRWYDTCLGHLQENVQASMPLHMNIVLAALNNMAIVSYDLCKFEKVHQIFQNVLEILSSYSCAEETPQDFQEEDMQGLLLNIILLHSSEAIAPAA